MVLRFPARRRSATLLAGIVFAGALLLALLWLREGRGAATPAPDARTAGDALAADALSGATPEERSTARAPLGVSAVPPPAEVPDPAWLRGRLVLDGAPVEAGGVALASADGAFRRWCALGPGGRFAFSGLPILPLSLTFELPPSDQRLLLPPRLELAPESGRPLELELDWHARQINLRVLDADRSGAEAHVEIRGPGLAASLATDADGNARLAVIEPGLYRLEALARGGRTGAAEVELDGSEDLSSVVLVVQTEAAADR